MSKDTIYKLADLAALAQKTFQEKHADIDPIIGINTQMRKQGYQADLMMIDNNVNKHRIMFIYKDANPEQVEYQFTYIDQDPSDEFKTVKVEHLDSDLFLKMMQDAL